MAPRHSHAVVAIPSLDGAVKVWTQVDRQASMATVQRAAARRWRPRRRLASALMSLLLTLALGLGLPLSQPARSQSAAQASPPSRTGEEIRAVWFTANDMDVLRDRERMRRAVKTLAELHFNTIYPVVWNSGFAYYPSAVSERNGLQDFQYRGLQGQDILKELIEEAHSQGLLVLPWFEFGFMVPPGSVLTRRQPDWLSRRRDGTLTSVSAAGEVSWLNPLHPKVQALLSELILEIATQYDADGIQFDDHTSLPSDFGYDAYTTGLYRRSTGREPPANPSDAAWLQWRANGISSFINRLHRQLQQKRPGFLVSLSPNYHDFAYKRQLQDWLTWLRQGSIDEVVVQIYRSDLASFEAELNRPEFAASRQRLPTAVGIFTGQRTQPVPIERVVAQAQAARRRGLGAAFFYYESLWEEAQEPAELRQQALDALYQQPAPRRSVAAGPRRPQPAGAAATEAGQAPAVVPSPSRPATSAGSAVVRPAAGLPAPGPSAAPSSRGSTAPAPSAGLTPPGPSPAPPAAAAASPAPAAAVAPGSIGPPAPAAPPPSPRPVSAPPASPLTPSTVRTPPLSRPSPAPSLPAAPAALPPPPPLQQTTPDPPELDPSWGPYNGAPAEPTAPL